jgi:pyridoxine 5-phosphate synthase
MTKLSVNMNKIALLRNSRGRDFPNLIEYANKLIALGVQGITVHPRQDERHITRKDAYELGELLSQNPAVEFNIEGYPSEEFLVLVDNIKPTQCTLVPDNPQQLTSDHGWDLEKDGVLVQGICTRLNAADIRSALFLDPDVSHVKLVPETGARRIEIYTEEYAASFNTPDHNAVFARYKDAALEAQRLGLGVNAGHDLDLVNLPEFLTIGGILEVSIGHALTIECIDRGMQSVVSRYLDICASAAA